jgi:hypothetical protein
MSNLDKLNQIITSLEEEGFYREADILMNVFERTAQVQPTYETFLGYLGGASSQTSKVLALMYEGKNFNFLSGSGFGPNQLGAVQEAVGILPNEKGFKMLFGPKTKASLQNFYARYNDPKKADVALAAKITTTQSYKQSRKSITPSRALPGTGSEQDF